MTFRRMMAAIIATAVAGVLVPLGPTPSASAAELVADGGFETTYAPTPNDVNLNDHWQIFDSQFGSPLCTLTDIWCGDAQIFDTQGTWPRTGNGWVWFGYTNAPGATAYVRQAVTLPPGTTTLSYWYRNGSVDAPFDATLTVSMDGHPLAKHTEASAPQAAYSQFTVDISPYADGGSHTLSFDYRNGAASSGAGNVVNNMTVDDISIASDTVAPGTSFTTAPAAVVRRLTVPVAFAADEAGSTFLCSLDGASFAACASPATLTVSPGIHTYRVAARDVAGNVDATPATVTFKAYDCLTLNLAKKQARHRVSVLKHRLIMAKVAVDDQKVHRLRKKLEKAHKVLYHARRAHRPCRL